MGEHTLVRRRASRTDGGKQGAVEPPPVLVAPLKVQIGRGSQLLSLLTDGRVADPGVKPDIENIRFLGEIVRAAGGTGGPRWQEVF